MNSDNSYLRILGLLSETKFFSEESPKTKLKSIFKIALYSSKDLVRLKFIRYYSRG